MPDPGIVYFNSFTAVFKTFTYVGTVIKYNNTVQLYCVLIYYNNYILLLYVVPKTIHISTSIYCLWLYRIGTLSQNNYLFISELLKINFIKLLN